VAAWKGKTGKNDALPKKWHCSPAFCLGVYGEEKRNADVLLPDFFHRRIVSRAWKRAIFLF
jgi:hypothetical protein